MFQINVKRGCTKDLDKLFFMRTFVRSLKLKFHEKWEYSRNKTSLRLCQVWFIAENINNGISEFQSLKYSGFLLQLQNKCNYLKICFHVAQFTNSCGKLNTLIITLVKEYKVSAPKMQIANMSFLKLVHHWKSRTLNLKSKFRGWGVGSEYLRMSLIIFKAFDIL